MAGSSSNNGQVGVCNAITEVRDGWDNEEWGSLEEEPVNILKDMFEYAINNNKTLKFCKFLK